MKYYETLIKKYDHRKYLKDEKNIREKNIINCGKITSIDSTLMVTESCVFNTDSKFNKELSKLIG